MLSGKAWFAAKAALTFLSLIAVSALVFSLANAAVWVPCVGPTPNENYASTGWSCCGPYNKCTNTIPYYFEDRTYASWGWVQASSCYFGKGDVCRSLAFATGCAASAECNGRTNIASPNNPWISGASSTTCNWCSATCVYGSCNFADTCAAGTCGASLANCGLTMTTGKTCTGSGCTSGTTYTCAAPATNCAQRSCGGTTYRCAYDGSSWAWRTTTPTEICTDNVDNDCDGLIDCNPLDPDCAQAPACTGSQPDGSTCSVSNPCSSYYPSGSTCYYSPVCSGSPTTCHYSTCSLSSNCGSTNRCGDSSGDMLYSSGACGASGCSFSQSTCQCGSSETDGGQNFLLKGTCTQSNGCSAGACTSSTYTDYCTGSNTLREYYASGSGDSATCTYADKACSDLGAGYSCYNGACGTSGVVDYCYLPTTTTTLPPTSGCAVGTGYTFTYSSEFTASLDNGGVYNQATGHYTFYETPHNYPSNANCPASGTYSCPAGNTISFYLKDSRYTGDSFYALNPFGKNYYPQDGYPAEAGHYFWTQGYGGPFLQSSASFKFASDSASNTWGVDVQRILCQAPTSSNCVYGRGHTWESPGIYYADSSTGAPSISRPGYYTFFETTHPHPGAGTWCPVRSFVYACPPGTWIKLYMSVVTGNNNDQFRICSDMQTCSDNENSGMFANGNPGYYWVTLQNLGKVRFAFRDFSDGTTAWGADVYGIECYVPTSCTGPITLNVNPNPVFTGYPVTYSASGLSNCGGPVTRGEVYSGQPRSVKFYQGGCTGGTLLESCSGDTGCSGGSFYSDTPGAYSLSATIDMNCDGDVTDPGECDTKIVNVYQCFAGQGATFTSYGTQTPNAQTGLPSNARPGQYTYYESQHYYPRTLTCQTSGLYSCPSNTQQMIVSFKYGGPGYDNEYNAGLYFYNSAGTEIGYEPVNGGIYTMTYPLNTNAVKMKWQCNDPACADGSFGIDVLSITCVAPPACPSTDTSCGTYPSCANCNNYDGWYNYGDSGPGCVQSNDPTAENRNYYCSANSCVYSTPPTNDCDSQDNWYGGGNTAGCGIDPLSQQRDYYVDSSGSCTYTTTSCGTTNCDSQDVCSNICQSNKIYSYKDFYAVSNSNTCTSALGSLVEDCLTKASTDTDSGDDSYNKGTVTDYTGCTDGASSCVYSQYTDSCAGNTLTEYYVSVPSYGSKAYDCTSYGAKYICSNGRCTQINCNSNADCDDSKPCTTDTCVNPGTESSSCTNANKAEGAPCPDDGLVCTDDACYSGNCEHRNKAVNTDCGDCKICTSGSCVDKTKPSCAECKSGPYCNVVTDAWSCNNNGLCTSCTGGYCDGSGGCVANPCGTCKYCSGSSCMNRADGTDPSSDCGAGCQKCVSGVCTDYNPACSGTVSSCYCSGDACKSCSASGCCDATCSAYSCKSNSNNAKCSGGTPFCNPSCSCVSCTLDTDCPADGWYDTGSWSCNGVCQRCKPQEYRDYSCLSGICNPTPGTTRNYCENAPSGQHCSAADGSFTTSGYCGSNSQYCDAERYVKIDRYECNGNNFCNAPDYTEQTQDCGVTSYGCKNSCTKTYQYTCSAGSCGTYSRDDNCPQGTACLSATCAVSNPCSTGSYECQATCTRGQKQNQCDGSGNCNVYWQWINLASCNSGFSCSAGSCGSTCSASCGADSACDGKTASSSCGTGKTCDSSCKCVVTACSGYSNSATCNADTNCAWCSGDSICHGKSTVVCQPPSCSADTKSKCSSTCAWQDSGSTDSSCYCSGGNFVACSGTTPKCSNYKCGCWQDADCKNYEICPTSTSKVICTSTYTVTPNVCLDFRFSYLDNTCCYYDYCTSSSCATDPIYCYNADATTCGDSSSMRYGWFSC